MCRVQQTKGKEKVVELIKAEVEAAVKKLKHHGYKFGEQRKPAAFSVRSGARASMPGMMDTILNLG
jgi:pyruvate, orthophosphate dikinase